MTAKQQATKEKYANFQLSKDKKKEVPQYPELDEVESKRMQDEFMKGNR